MSQKKLIPFINAENEMPGSVISLADRYACEGADGLYLYNFTGDEKSREEFLATVRQIEKKIDIPFYVGIYVARFEDAKKALYTGASMVVMRKALLPVDKELQEITDRFSKDKLALEVDMRADFMTAEQLDEYYELGIGTAVLKHIDTTPSFSDTIAQTKMRVMVRDGLIRNDLAEILSYDTVSAVLTNYFEDKDIYKAKKALKKKNVDVEVFESLIDFSDFKLLDNGLIPVVVQDYRTNEVLMVAYMNEDSYKMTIDTGKMTYYSRSRKKLWLKGETSGHFQYVKSLMIDCDNDTILAKVRQIGAACHTGNRSCFFKELAKKDYVSTNPLTVLMDDYDIIMSRKNISLSSLIQPPLTTISQPIRLIGQKAAEIIIAAKNPDAEELKYEIADFLYHMMVLMAECGLDWNDITKELVNRR